MPNLIFSFLPNYDHIILATCDSSQRRASWIFWQEYDGKPKVLSYNHKTFPSSHSAYPPSLLELVGVLFCCKQAHVEYNGMKVILYTDCLPLTMCALPWPLPPSDADILSGSSLTSRPKRDVRFPFTQVG